MEMKDRARRYFGTLQDEICSALEQADGTTRFREDRWKHQPGGASNEGGGITRVISGGDLLEKGGVNLSAVTGDLSPKLAQRLKVEPQRFFATGISLVLHPQSPRVPTTHMNLRYLQLSGPGQRAWFGGGADLTPYYLHEKDAAHFHRCLKRACDGLASDRYARFKQWCDDYFYLSHRGESRGVGGIFFDYLEEDPERTFDFVRQVGAEFLKAYLPIVEARRGEPWGERERAWQEIRRGRYVEFNLIHDRGTLFGLETKGRTESILMSLPPTVRWEYDHRPEPGSPEAVLIEALAEPREWLEP